MDLTVATREIFWQIPFSFKVTMYVMMFAAFAVLAQGVLKKYKYVIQKGSFKDLLPKKLNWSKFINTIFFTGKVTRDKKVGLFHSFIYYGFVVLTIATELVAIHADSPFKVYQGKTYIIISFLADFAGIFILIGLTMAYKRRYIDKPDYLSATNPGRERWMYAMIFLLVVIGFFLEGMRIVGAGMPTQESVWSPFGFMLAKVIYSIGINESTLGLIYKWTWMFHMINTMVFIASVGHTKFFHIIALPFNALITPDKRGAVLEPMDFEDETAETFGLGKASELTAKQRMDTLSCVECGRCTEVCPPKLPAARLILKK